MLGHLAGLLAICVIAATLVERNAQFAKGVALLYLLIWVGYSTLPTLWGAVV